MATLQPLLSSRFSSCFSFSPTPLDVHLFRIVATQRCFLLSLAVLFSCSSYCARAKFSQARSIPSTRQCVILPHVFALFPYFIRRYGFLTNAVFLHRKERERDRESKRGGEERILRDKEMERASACTSIEIYPYPFIYFLPPLHVSLRRLRNVVELDDDEARVSFLFFFFSNFFSILSICAAYKCN